uniref:NADH-ubiquinone oxidoreductase chain 3 n=1 Tax=Pontoscolex corethrurus TaxID=195581 RepID=A0A1W5LJU5_9ANNE|nr:NADH dehydrogenase subunit 3 [Pontoscolex corethrurus]ANJ60063.1 NADH dehydrogenase subunit 3 [Pontoscolex corethrurus]
MNLLLFASSLSIIIPSVLLITSLFLRKRSTQDREKSSPFECGFDPKSMARIPFSMRFFLLAIIFIVFDIEIVLLMPIPISMTLCNSTTMVLVPLMFLAILIAGLLHEWNEGALDWSK